MESTRKDAAMDFKPPDRSNVLCLSWGLRAARAANRFVPDPEHRRTIVPPGTAGQPMTFFPSGLYVLVRFQHMLPLPAYRVSPLKTSKPPAPFP